MEPCSTMTKATMVTKINNHTSLYYHMLLAPLSIPLHKFPRPPFYCSRWSEIENYDFRVVPNGTTSIPSFIQIPPVVFELYHADGRKHRRTRLALYALILCTSCKERITSEKLCGACSVRNLCCTSRDRKTHIKRELVRCMFGS
jgi:hypothetical protein